MFILPLAQSTHWQAIKRGIKGSLLTAWVSAPGEELSSNIHINIHCWKVESSHTHTLAHIPWPLVWQGAWLGDSCGRSSLANTNWNAYNNTLSRTHRHIQRQQKQYRRANVTAEGDEYSHTRTLTLNECTHRGCRPWAPFLALRAAAKQQVNATVH